MRARNPRRLFCALAVAGLASSAWAGGVRIVERPDVGPFLTIQAGVNAAFDGETLLVGKGVYAPFMLVAKPLSIIGDNAGQVTVNGTVTVSGLPSNGTVVLSGLSITGPTFGGHPPGLKLTSNAGHVRIEGCALVGGHTFDSYDADAGPGAEVNACPQVVFVACTMSGGDVGYCSGCTGTPGGDGVNAINSGVALYDCILHGGEGSEESVPGGQGGHGYFGESWGVVASGCTFTGGQGGGADYLGCWTGGNGGDGVRVVGAQAHWLDSSMAGGPGGTFGFCGPGAPGQPITSQGGVLDPLAGTRRKLTLPPIASDDAPLAATLIGEAGDRVFLVTARKPSYLFVKAFHGVWCVPLPLFMPSVPFTVLASTGSTNLSLPVPNLHAPESSKILVYQALIVDNAGLSYLSSPQHVLLFDRDSAPDCNGNGANDFVDTTVGGEPDANDDFIPDTCGGFPTVHWVDAGAPAGGDGHSATPFQTIRAGLDASLTGYTVIVRNGVYTGTLNRNLDFTGRDLVVKSENGPANCVIDCQGQGRAFTIKAPSTLAARVEGLTIRNGVATTAAAIDATSVTVWDCVIESCTTPTPTSTSFGGAIAAARFDIRRCTFRSNDAGTHPTFSRGGAISLIPTAPAGPTPRIQDCLFVDNHASLGGAIFASTNSGLLNDILIAHCEFRSNLAVTAGGGIYSTMGNGATLGAHIDDCLFAGNSGASYGGAIAADKASAGGLWITSCTFAGNSTFGFGGALSVQRSITASVQNCVMWGDVATSGGELSLRTGSPSLSVASCDVQGGQAGVDWLNGTLTWGSGNLNVDPVYADPDGADNNPATFGDNDYTLAIASPCIDAGDNNLIAADFLDIDGDGNVSEPVPLDLLLHPRRVDVPSAPNTGNGSSPLVDIGAYERP